MIRLSPLLLVIPALFLAGCGSGEENKESAKATPQSEDSVQPAGKAVRAEGIAMSFEGNTVHVGDAWESAEKLFPEHRGSYRLRSLPARFGSSFEAHGWESTDRQGDRVVSYGYGVVTYKDMVIAAVYHAEDQEPAHAQELLDAQRNGTGTLKMTEVKTGDLQWNYWEDGTQRLMVLQDKGKKGTDVTVLMGDAKVLDALGATKPVGPDPSTAPFLSSPPPASSADLPVKS